MYICRIKSFLSKISLLIWVFVFVLFNTGWSVENNITFKRLTVADGLSQGTIYDICQDSKGFMWFGTRGGGLNKYDSYSFQTYNHKANDSTSISSDHVHCIAEGKDGSLWLGTKDGLNKYDYNLNSFSQYFPVIQQLESISNVIISIVIDKDNTIWLGTRDGLFSFNPSNEIFTRHFEGTQIKNIVVNHIYESKNGDLWLGTQENGLIRYIIAEGSYKQFKHDPDDPKSLSINIVKTIFEDSYNNLWVGGNGLQKIINITSGIFETIVDNKLDYAVVWAIEQVNRNELWLGTSKGLFIYNTEDKSSKFFHSDPKNSTKHAINSIFSLNKDANGNIWIGTCWGGVNLVEKQKYFEWHQFQSNESTNCLNNIVTSFVEDKNQIWVGTELDGLLLFDMNSRSFQSFENDPNILEKLIRYGIRTECKGLDGELWLGTNGGLNKFNPNTHTYERFIMPFNVIAIEQVAPHRLLIGSSSGLYSFDIQTKKYQVVQDSTSTINFSNLFIKKFFVDSKKRLWIGTANEGIILYRSNLDNYIPYKIKGGTSSLGANTITSIHEDYNGEIWVGTQNGIYKYDPQTNQFLYPDFNKKLTDLQIKGVLSDDHGILWISSNQGITKLNPKTNDIHIYGVSDGLQNNEFYDGSCLKTSDGEMLFGGLSGFNIFHPDSISEYNSSTPLILTDFKIKYQSMHPGEKGTPLVKSINDTKNLTLKYNQNAIGFDFTAIDYFNSQKIQYSYFLEGFDKDWVLAGNQRSAAYTNIPSGDYIFHIKKTNNYGVWDKQERVLTIQIKPPIWKTTFAIVLYIILFITLLLFFRKITISRIEQKNLLENEKMEKERIKEMNNMKLRFFTNISHEFRTPLSLIIGPIEKLISLSETPQEDGSLLQIIKRNARILQNLINELMDFRKLETGNMKLILTKTDINNFITNNYVSFKTIAVEKEIDFDIKIPSVKEDIYFDQDKLLRILYNLLSNSFKYTPKKGKVFLSGSTKAIPKNELLKNDLIITSAQNPLKEYIELAVEDNGLGMSADQLPKIFDRFYQIEGCVGSGQPGSGVGLTLVKNLVLLMKGDILVASEKGIGTRFTVRLPIIREYESEKSVSETLPGIADKIFLPEYSSEDSKIEETTKHEYWFNQHLAGELKYKVLIVEDNSDLRIFLKDTLSEHFLITEAADGEEGLRKAMETVPDLILSDVMMPKLSGTKLCEKIKMNTLTSHIPVILLTALTSIEHTIEGLETGADLYIAKPFNVNLILVQIQNLIKSREALRQRFKKESFLHPSEITVTSLDEKFLKKAMAYVEKHIDDENLNVKTLYEEMAMSRSNLQLKIKALTGLSPNEYIRAIRLNRAAQLLVDCDLTIVEIAYKTGFNSPSYFSKSFKSQFNMSPNEYVKNKSTS